MSFNALQTITGKVRTRSPFQALSSRYTFLGLRESEPNLGVPGPAGVAPTNDGIRYPVLSNALSGVSAWRVFAYDNPKIAAYSKVNALAIGDNAFVGPTKNSMVYSNYLYGGNRYNSTALADNSFNVYSLSGIYLYNPTTIGDPLSAIAFVVDEKGNTGIGTDSPREKLDVIGNARASGTLSATYGGLFGCVKSNASFVSQYTNVRSLSSRWANLLTNKIAIQAYYPGQYAFKDNTFFSMINDDGYGGTIYASLKYAAYNFENNKANFYALTAYPIFPIGNDLLDGCSISFHNNKTIVQYASGVNFGDMKCYEIYDATDPFNPVLQKTHLAPHDSDVDFYTSSCKLISYSTNTTPVSNYRIKVGVSGKITTLYYNNDLSDVREVFNDTPSYTGGTPYDVNTGATNIYQVSAGLWHLAIYNAPYNNSGFAYNIFKFDNTGRPQNSTGIPFYPPGGANPIDYVCLNSFLSANMLYTFRQDAYVVWVSRFNNVPGAPLTTLQVVNLSAVMASAGLPAVSDSGFTGIYSNIFVAGDYLVLPNLNWYDPDNTYGYGDGADFQLRLKLNADGTVDVPNSYIVQCNTSMFYGPVLPNFVSTDSNFNIYNVGDTAFASKTNRAEITTLQVKDLSFSKCNAIVPASVTDTGKFLTLTVNGEQKAIRLWDYTT